MTDLSPAQPSQLRSIVSQTLRDSGYLMAGFPIALTSFIILVTGISVGVGLVIVWVGIPILAGTLFVGHWFANLERARLGARGTHLEGFHSAPTATGRFRRFLKAITSGAKWRETLHGIISMPLATVSWSLMISWWAMALGGLTGWIWFPISRLDGPEHTGLAELLRWWIPEELLYLAIGVFAVVTLPWLVKGLCVVHAALGRGLLSPSRQDLAQRVTELTQAREHLGQAETSTLRRLEQDIHDGPQQSLIRLGMDLSAAERRIAEGDTDTAKELIAGSRMLNDSIIASLRALSRGMIPPVLAERGIVAALAQVAATSPIPVSLEPRLETEPGQQVAAAAYFVACEALANAAKHSSASKVNIFIGSDDHDRLILEIRDNGAGGAIVVPGHGLAGLAERVEALDGKFEVDNIGGTRLCATLPM